MLIEPDEIAALKPLSEHVMTIGGFVDKGEVDPIYFEKPYYLSPADKPSLDPFSLLREAMSKTSVAALATVVLFQRERHVLL
ncbi:Ku protein [Mesorhizobium sp. KR1-2]|uniref:Ku protein n=1 Tax=Mesorhizobium sp. KR1-2 TaxID=3156609 RepID=UPI0032B319F8